MKVNVFLYLEATDTWFFLGKMPEEAFRAIQTKHPRATFDYTAF